MILDDFAKKLMDYGAPYVTFFIPIPFPGSELYNIAINGDYLNKNFDTIKNIKLPKTIETILIIKPIKNPKKNPEANNNISPPGNEKLK